MPARCWLAAASGDPAGGWPIASSRQVASTGAPCHRRRTTRLLTRAILQFRLTLLLVFWQQDAGRHDAERPVVGRDHARVDIRVAATVTVLRLAEEQRGGHV